MVSPIHEFKYGADAMHPDSIVLGLLVFIAIKSHTQSAIQDTISLKPDRQ